MEHRKEQQFLFTFASNIYIWKIHTLIENNLFGTKCNDKDKIKFMVTVIKLPMRMISLLM